MGRPFSTPPLLSAIPRLKYRSPPFDGLLLAVILVYLPLLSDGFSLRKTIPPVAEAFSSRSMAAADAERHGLRQGPFQDL